MGTAGVQDALLLVTGRWGVPTLATLTRGRVRYSALRAQIPGISEKMLAKTLRDLECAGLVNRRQQAAMAPHVDYSLRALGIDIAYRMRGLMDWVDLHVHDLSC